MKRYRLFTDNGNVILFSVSSEIMIFWILDTHTTFTIKKDQDWINKVFETIDNEFYFIEEI